MAVDRAAGRARQAAAAATADRRLAADPRCVGRRPACSPTQLPTPLRSQLDRTTPLPKVPEWERISTEMQTVAELVVRGRMTRRRGGREMDQRADRLLEKRRWMCRGRGRHEGACRRYSPEARAGWLMTGPALAAIGLFFVCPAFASLVLSFTDFDIYALANLSNLRFIGFENYQRLMTNPLFWQAMGNTMWFVIFGVPLMVVASLPRHCWSTPRH